MYQINVFNRCSTSAEDTLKMNKLDMNLTDNDVLVYEDKEIAIYLYTFTAGCIRFYFAQSSQNNIKEVCSNFLYDFLKTHEWDSWGEFYLPKGTLETRHKELVKSQIGRIEEGEH